MSKVGWNFFRVPQAILEVSYNLIAQSFRSRIEYRHLVFFSTSVDWVEKVLPFLKFFQNLFPLEPCPEALLDLPTVIL